MIDELKLLVREVTEEDRKVLPTVSYSKLDNFVNCALSHKLKYIDKNFSKISTLAMSIGSITHFGLETKGQYILKNEPIDYEKIKDYVVNGYVDEKDPKNNILGINDLRRQYFEEWWTKDEKSGMNYEEKVQLYFDKVLPTRIEDKNWKLVGTEISFEFVYDNRVIIHGFIDRVDESVTEEKIYRITDYKSSKKVFENTKIKTPMQHVVYDLACLHMFGVIPEEHEYDFILIDKLQTSKDGVCSKGYLKRGIKKLNKILDTMDEMEEKGEYPPNPTPLCYWCTFHSDSPNSDPKYRGLCLYHSLWTPTNKNFKVLNEYNGIKNMNEATKKRKLIF